MADDKITGFLSKDTAGLPNWAWILVVGAGIAAVYILPKFFPGTSSNASSSTGATDTSGLGLAIDPTTGLPYAVEGLVPSGGGVGGVGTDTGGAAQGAPPGQPLPPPTFIGPPQTPPQGTGAAPTYTTKGGETFASLANAKFSATQIQQWALSFYPWLAPYGSNQPLPAGLTLVIGPGTVRIPGSATTSSPQVAPTSPAWPGGTTQMRVGG